MSDKKVIPVEFYNPKKAGKPSPCVKTVGELKAQLERLPNDMIFSTNEDESLECIVANHGKWDEVFFMHEVNDYED